jgi:hypothetical protein
VAQQVLRESRAEADAALRYAHEVRRVTVVCICPHGKMTPQSLAGRYSCYMVIIKASGDQWCVGILCSAYSAYAPSPSDQQMWLAT